MNESISFCIVKNPSPSLHNKFPFLSSRCHYNKIFEEKQRVNFPKNGCFQRFFRFSTRYRRNTFFPTQDVVNIIKKIFLYSCLAKLDLHNFPEKFPLWQLLLSKKTLYHFFLHPCLFYLFPSIANHMPSNKKQIAALKQRWIIPFPSFHTIDRTSLSISPTFLPAIS